MYNGIGLRTARGSGTNGFVQRNLSHVNPPKSDRNTNNHSSTKKHFKKANQEIVLHEKKRKIESDLFLLKNELIEKGELSEEQMEAYINEERTKRVALLAPSSSSSTTTTTTTTNTTHEARVAQEQKNAKMEEALQRHKKKRPLVKEEQEEEQPLKKPKNI